MIPTKKNSHYIKKIWILLNRFDFYQNRLDYCSYLIIMKDLIIIKRFDYIRIMEEDVFEGWDKRRGASGRWLTTGREALINEPSGWFSEGRTAEKSRRWGRYADLATSSWPCPTTAAVLPYTSPSCCLSDDWDVPEPRINSNPALITQPQNSVVKILLLPGRNWGFVIRDDYYLMRLLQPARSSTHSRPGFPRRSDPRGSRRVPCPRILRKLKQKTPFLSYNFTTVFLKQNPAFSQSKIHR